MSDEAYRYYKISPGERRILIEKIRYILEREKIDLAIAFGSFVELKSFRDIDIAIYGKNVELRDLLRISAELENELKIPVDVVPLSMLPPRFRHHILVKGEVIIDRRTGLYEALLMQTLDEAAVMESP